MRDAGRSGCPINLTLEVIGDRWSLIVLRDMMFGNRRHFRELLAGSEEGIASNILSARLKHLLAVGLVTRAADPDHRQKATYSLTEAAIDLVPVIAADVGLGPRHQPVTPDLAIRARLLSEGGSPLVEAFMAELRHLHLGAPEPARAVLAELDAAFRAALLAGADAPPPPSALTAVAPPGAVRSGQPERRRRCPTTASPTNARPTGTRPTGTRPTTARPAPACPTTA